jgi:Tol biopolymer transport system component
MSLWGELKRRKVVQVAAVYAVVAWLLTQIAATVEQPLSLPSWFDTAVITLVAIGFPIAIILAWAFDVGPQGVRAAGEGSSAATHATGHWFGQVTQVLVLLAVGFLVLDQYFFDDRAQTAADSSRVGSGSTASQSMRFTVTLPEGIRFAVGEDFWRSASVSPDGEHIVFTGLDEATGTIRMYVRPIDSVEVTPLPGSEDGNSAFWSPDGRSVGFVANGELKIVSLEGGPPRAIVEAMSFGGASWNKDDLILASLENPGPIFLIPVDTGVPTPVTTYDPSLEADHLFPQFLDDGEHFLYMATGRARPDGTVFVGSLSAKTRTLLLEGVFGFVYAAPDHVIFLRGGTLFAQAFDTTRFALEGQPMPIAGNALPPISVSRTGALTYRTTASTPLPLIWIRTDGSVIGPALPPGYYVDPMISPDGTRVAYASRESLEDTLDISILDLASGVSRQLTLDPANDRAPVWSPDGRTIVFQSLRAGAPGLYKKNADGAGAEELILTTPDVVWPFQWTDAGLSYFADRFRALDVWIMSPDDPADRTLLIQTPYIDVDGAISPDGKWLVYATNETGGYELYLTTYPPSSTKLVVTTRGGADPIWSPDGTELFYVNPSTAELMAVAVTSGNPPQFGALRRVHSGPLFFPDAISFSVDPRGDRILVAPSFAPAGDITILLNWQAATQ